MFRANSGYQCGRAAHVNGDACMCLEGVIGVCVNA